MLFAHDGMIFTRYINCADCIFATEKAFAYGFYLSLDQSAPSSAQTGMGQPLPALNYIKDDVYAWAFHYAPSGDWRAYNNCACTLYRTKQIVEQVADLEFTTYSEFARKWKNVPINLENVGLCFGQPKVGYITWR